MNNPLTAYHDFMIILSFPQHLGVMTIFSWELGMVHWLDCFNLYFSPYFKALPTFHFIGGLIELFCRGRAVASFEIPTFLWLDVRYMNSFFWDVLIRWTGQILKLKLKIFFSHIWKDNCKNLNNCNNFFINLLKKMAQLK